LKKEDEGRGKTGEEKRRKIFSSIVKTTSTPTRELEVQKTR